MLKLGLLLAVVMPSKRVVLMPPDVRSGEGVGEVHPDAHLSCGRLRSSRPTLHCWSFASREICA